MKRTTPGDRVIWCSISFRDRLAVPDPFGPKNSSRCRRNRDHRKLTTFFRLIGLLAGLNGTALWVATPASLDALGLGSLLALYADQGESFHSNVASEDAVSVKHIVVGKARGLEQIAPTAPACLSVPLRAFGIALQLDLHPLEANAIHTDSTNLGSLLTVPLEVTVDAGGTTFSFFLPSLQVPTGRTVEFNTIGIYKEVRGQVVAVAKQVVSWRTIAMRGTPETQA